MREKSQNLFDVSSIANGLRVALKELGFKYWSADNPTNPYVPGSHGGGNSEHAGIPGHVGGSGPPGGGLPLGVSQSALTEADVEKINEENATLNTGAEIRVIRNDAQLGPIVLMYHGSQHARDIREGGFDPSAPSRYTAIHEGGIYLSQGPEYASQHGDVLSLEVPLRAAHFVQNNPLDADNDYYLPGDEFFVPWGSVHNIKIGGVTSGEDILADYRARRASARDAQMTNDYE